MGGLRAGVIVRRLVPFGIGCALLAAAGEAAAKSPRDRESLVRLVRPEFREGVFRDGAPLVLSVRPRTRVRVEIGARAVTRQLHLRMAGRRSGRVLLRGRIPRRLVPRSPRPLRVSGRRGGRKDGELALVYAVRRDRGFASLRLQRGPGSPIPVRARLRTRIHRVDVRVELNGRRLVGRTEIRRARERTLTLTRAEGLRYGRNVLRISVDDGRRTGDVEQRTFVIPRTHPIPGVRAPRRSVHGAIVRFDARTTIASAPGRRLRFRWRLTDRPTGSDARLRNAHGRVATLRADRSGRYAARLVVGERGRGARAAASTGLEVATQTAPPIPPSGIPITVDPKSGVTIGERTIPMPAQPQSLLFVVIDRTTGRVVSVQPIGPGSAGYDLGLLAAQLDGNYAGPGFMMMVVAPGGAESNPQYMPGRTAYNTLRANLSFIGLGSQEADDAAFALAHGQAAGIIGVPGSGAGTAAANTLQGSSAVGHLQGRLMLTGISSDLTGVLVFAQPDYVRFSLGGADGQTRITPVNAPWGVAPSGPVDAPPLDGTMAVTVLDAVTLQKVASAASDPGPQSNALAPVRNLLQQYYQDPSKLVLFKMRAPWAWENTRLDMSPISKFLALMGANRSIFIESLKSAAPELPQVRGTPIPNGADYVFLGGAGVNPVEGTPIETVDAPDGSPVPAGSTNLSGTLHRTASGSWEPTQSATDDRLLSQFDAILASEPTAYSYPTDIVPGTAAQYSAAELQLFKLLQDTSSTLCDATSPSCSYVPGLRVNYPNQAFLDHIDDVQRYLHCLDSGYVDKAPAGASFSSAQLRALRIAICNETGTLEAVHENLVTPLEGAYTTLMGDSTLDLINENADLFGFLQDKQDADLSRKSKFLGASGELADVLEGLAEGALKIAAYFAAPEVGPAIEPTLGKLFVELAPATLGVAGGSLGAASELTETESSNEKLAKTELTVASLATYIQQSYGFAAGRLREIEAQVVSDPSKLRAVYDLVHSGAWDFTQPVSETNDRADVVVFQQQIAARQYMLPQLISAVAKPCDTGGSASDPTTFRAGTALTEYRRGEFQFGDYLTWQVHQLRSVRLTSEDAPKLGKLLFASPFDGSENQLESGPAGAAINRSPFFMIQIAPTSTSKADDCSEYWSDFP